VVGINGGKIVNDKNILTSSGYYTPKVECLLDVTYNLRSIVKSDTLKYNTISKIAYFFGPTNIYGKSRCLYMLLLDSILLQMIQQAKIW
jgi:hypothetical protein